jgi:hypothetical protein
MAMYARDLTFRLTMRTDTPAFRPSGVELIGEIARVLRTLADTLDRDPYLTDVGDLYDRDNNEIGFFQLSPDGGGRSCGS